MAFGFFIQLGINVMSAKKVALKMLYTSPFRLQIGMNLKLVRI